MIFGESSSCPVPGELPAHIRIELYPAGYSVGAPGPTWNPKTKTQR